MALAASRREVLAVDDPPPPAGRRGDLAVAPETIAYIFFTSGSTGGPKGVADTHRNVLHNVRRYTDALRISPADRLSLLQSPSFSGAVSSTFGALLNGAALMRLLPAQTASAHGHDVRAGPQRAGILTNIRSSVRILGHGVAASIGPRVRSDPYDDQVLQTLWALSSNPDSTWPPLVFDEIFPTAENVHRLSQIAGKYTLGEQFEPAWGRIALTVTPRGFRTPTLQRGGTDFEVTFDLVGDEISIATPTGTVLVPLHDGPSVADTYRAFVEAAGSVGVPPPDSPREVELPDGVPFVQDTAPRTYDSAAASTIAAAFSKASHALNRWQASYVGYRPSVGVMWGGFDLAATRYSGKPLDPPASMPIFQQNGMNGEVVALGFFFGDPDSKTPAFYAYISPPPKEIGDADLSDWQATWVQDAGLFVLPWDSAVAVDDPEDLVVRFGDAVWALAVDDGWPSDRTIERHPGAYASHHHVPFPDAH